MEGGPSLCRVGDSPTWQGLVICAHCWSPLEAPCLWCQPQIQATEGGKWSELGAGDWTHSQTPGHLLRQLLGMKGAPGGGWTGWAGAGGGGTWEEMPDLSLRHSTRHWCIWPEQVGTCGSGVTAGLCVHRYWKTATSGGSFATAAARQATYPKTSWTRSGRRTWVPPSNRCWGSLLCPTRWARWLEEGQVL